MITRIHVNRHHITANRRDGGNRPVYSVKQGGKTYPCRTFTVLGTVRGVYRPEKPLSCGAVAWLETTDTVVWEG